MMKLISVTEDNWLDIASLAVKEHQKTYVAPAGGILARGYVYRDCSAKVHAFEQDGVIVGLALVREFTDEPLGYDLQQFMIDGRYQNRGYGTQALKLILDELRKENHYDHVELCVKKADVEAIHLYEKLGFVDSGYADEDQPDSLNMICRLSGDERSAGNEIVRPVTIEDYDEIYALWNSAEQTRKALNPVDDSREGIKKYLNRNPDTCFLAAVDDGAGNRKIVGVILTGHDGRRGIIHHLCVHPDFRRRGIARMLVRKAEDALRAEGITKVFGLVFKTNEAGNAFWEQAGYSLRTNLNYRNKSLNANVPKGE